LKLLQLPGGTIRDHPQNIVKEELTRKIFHQKELAVALFRHRFLTATGSEAQFHLLAFRGAICTILL
jgi:hypothetical protein